MNGWQHMSVGWFSYEPIGCDEFVDFEAELEALIANREKDPHAKLGMR